MRRLLIVTQKVDAQDQPLAFFIAWIQRLASRCDNVIILCLQKGEYPPLGQNIEVVSLGKEHGNSKLDQVIRFYKNIIVRRKEYDVVFVHMNPIWAVLGGPVWHFMKKRIFLWYTHKAVTLRLRLAHRQAHTVFTASPESFRISSRKVIVTGHGIDGKVFLPDPAKRSSGLAILSVGRITAVKNYDVLIAAAKILADRGVAFRVTVVGEPALASDVEYEKQLKIRITSLSLGDKIVFVGKKQWGELVEQYQSHSLFVHMSKTGSLDKAVLEAMACGMTSVSSNDASRAFLPPEYVFDENDPADLAAKIQYASEHPKNFRDYVVQNHDLDSLINKISQHLWTQY